MQNLSDDAVLNKLYDWNCEWLTRPNIAMSEMAATLIKNSELIQLYRGMIFTNGFIDEIESVLEHIVSALWRLDNKDNSDQTLHTQEDVISVLQQLLHRDEHMEELMLDAFYSAKPLFLVEVHSIVPNVLLHNCPEYVFKMECNNSNESPQMDQILFLVTSMGRSANLLGQISGKKTKHCQDH